MFVKPLIGNVNQLVIKTPLCNAALIPRYRNDCSALWIERESDSPNAAICIEAELLHVGVARALQGYRHMAVRELALFRECFAQKRSALPELASIVL
jgi:hypothetical protein